MATLTLNIGTTKATAGKSEMVRWLLRKAEKVGFRRARFLPSDDGQHDIVAFSSSVWAELDHADSTFKLHRQDDDGLRSGNWWPADDSTDLAACLAILKKAKVVQTAKLDAPDDVPVAAVPTRPAPTPTAPKGKAKGQPAARKVNGNGKQVRKPARRKADPKVAVVKFLTEKQLRESFYMKLFKAADPSQTALIPTMLGDVAAVREKEARVHDKQGREADRDRCLHDVAACRGIAAFILGEKDKATRSRLQDIDDRGLARLVELVDLKSGHSEEVEDAVAVLVDIKPEILAAIDKLVGPADDEPAPPTKPKGASKAPAARPAPKVAPKKAGPQPKAKPAKAKLAPNEVKVVEPVRRPAQANPKPKAEKPAAYSHREEPNPDGPSELETGKVTRVDERVVKALRAALDDALHGVAQRFDLKYSVVKGQYTPESGVFRIELTTKDGSPITVHQSDAAPIVSTTSGGGKPLPPITRRLSKTAKQRIAAANKPKKARKAAAAK